MDASFLEGVDASKRRWHEPRTQQKVQLPELLDGHRLYPQTRSPFRRSRGYHRHLPSECCTLLDRTGMRPGPLLSGGRYAGAWPQPVQERTADAFRGRPRISAGVPGTGLYGRGSPPSHAANYTLQSVCTGCAMSDIPALWVIPPGEPGRSRRPSSEAGPGRVPEQNDALLEAAGDADKVPLFALLGVEDVLQLGLGTVSPVTQTCSAL